MVLSPLPREGVFRGDPNTYSGFANDFTGTRQRILTHQLQLFQIIYANRIRVPASTSVAAHIVFLCIKGWSDIVIMRLENLS